MKRPPGGPPGPSVVIFDDQCALCRASVRFIERHDPADRFRFAPFGSPAATDLVGDAASDTVLLVEGAQVFDRSTAALRIALRLRYPWPLLFALIAVPRPVRDAVYRWIARRRPRCGQDGAECG